MGGLKFRLHYILSSTKDTLLYVREIQKILNYEEPIICETNDNKTFFSTPKYIILIIYLSSKFNVD